MGEPAKKAAVQTALRRAGDNLNVLGHPHVHEKTSTKPTGKNHRQTICRCWLSLKFPLCDNTHQRLQKQGLNIGPCMLELKPGAAPVSANAIRDGPGTGPQNLAPRFAP